MDDEAQAMARYVEARRTFVEEYAELRQARRAWQLVAGALAIVAAVAVTGLSLSLLRPGAIPYVVELDADKQLVRTYPAEPMRSPSAQYTRATLGRWIQAWRSVSPDPWIIEERTNFVFAAIQSDSAAESRVAEWMRANNPYRRAAGETVAVAINAITKRGQGASWQVDWEEKLYARDGRARGSKRYTAVLLVAHGKPKEEMVLLNPGGLYITDIDWQEEWVDE